MFDGILGSITDSLNILKPPEGGSSFKQPQYPGQGLISLGLESMKPESERKKLPTIPELNAQMELQKKAPFVARTPDQAVLNAPTQQSESSFNKRDYGKLFMALSNIKPPKEEPLRSMSSGRVGGGFSMPSQSLYETPGFREKFAQAGMDRGVPISQLIPGIRR